MNVSVKYFNPFREITGKKDELVQLDEPTIAGLVSKLANSYGTRFRQTILSPEVGNAGARITSDQVIVAESIGILVSGRYATVETRLQDGDEVAFLLKAVGG